MIENYFQKIIDDHQRSGDLGQLVFLAHDLGTNAQGSHMPKNLTEERDFARQERRAIAVFHDGQIPRLQLPLLHVLRYDPFQRPPVTWWQPTKKTISKDRSGLGYKIDGPRHEWLFLPTKPNALAQLGRGALHTVEGYTYFDESK